MQNIRLKISLPGSEPLIWREVTVRPETYLPDLHRIIQIVMPWENAHMHGFYGKNRKAYDPDEDDYYDPTLEELFPRKGSKLTYIYDFGDNWEHLIESLGKVPADPDINHPQLVDGANACPPEDCGGLWGYYENLEVINDPENEEYEEIKEWMGDASDPLHFDPKNARERLQSIDWDAIEEEEFDSDFFDMDQGLTRTIDFEWLEKEHGIRLTEDHVRNVPEEVANFLSRAQKEYDLNPFLLEAEQLYKQYSKDLTMAMAMASMYTETGNELKAIQVAMNLPKPGPDDVLFKLNMLMQANHDEASFVKKVKKYPRPLNINNLPAGEGGYYNTEEFLMFEDVAIRFALATGDLAGAVDRLDRLVKAGFLHNDVRSAGMMIASEQLLEVQRRLVQSDANPVNSIPNDKKPILPRTQEILDVSMQDVLRVFRDQDSGGFGDFNYDDDDDDFRYEPAPSPLKMVHPEHDPAQPFIAKKKIERNAPCPCGSGKKYKQCCLRS